MVASETAGDVGKESGVDTTDGDLVTFTVKWAGEEDETFEKMGGGTQYENTSMDSKLSGESPDQTELRMQALADAIARMKPTRPEIVRAVPVGAVLFGLGRPLRSAKGKFYGLSRPATQIHAFWSHSWHGSAWMKILAAIFLNNSTPASVVSTTLAVCVIPLYVLDFLPSILPSCGWCSMVGSVAYLLTLLLWRRISSRSVFVDRCCIHQTHAKLKAEGVFSLGAIIKASYSLVVFWDRSYAQRLWCVFEMAAFLHTHPDKKQVRIQPTIFGPLLSISSLSAIMLNLGIHSMYNMAWQNSFILGLLLLLAYCGLVVVPMATMSRQYFREVGYIRKQIADFSLENSEAYCCSINHQDPVFGTPVPCDRGIIRRCVLKWFGSIEGFHDRVRGDVQQALLDRMTSQALSYKVFVEVSCPIFWPFLDFFAAYVKWALAEDTTMGYVYVLIFRGLAYWLAVTPTVLYVFTRLAHVTQEKRSSWFHELCVSMVSVTGVLGLMGIYAAVDLLPWTLFFFLFSGFPALAVLPFVVFSFAALLCTWRLFPVPKPTAHSPAGVQL